MKILSIGNSFSENMQTYVHQMAEAAGENVTVVNAYYGGCTMRRHTVFYDKKIPIYRRYMNGKCEEEGVTLQSIISSDKFDFVTFQPGTGGWEEQGEVTPNAPYFGRLIGIAKEYQPQATLVYNHYWADSDTSTRNVFRLVFGSDREKMRALWQKYADQAKNEYGIEYINPCGLAVDIAYKEMGDRLYLDGYHMSWVGNYLLGCEWLEYFTGKRTPESFIPTPPENPKIEVAAPDARELEIMREAAHKAVLSVKNTPASLGIK
ncbi:MAG: DUF4886 domain-containing protein [Clostridia bacterium]|nr:DUF4886 domain-containing protein [Clostridia bacterium]